jgi:hypothetical protein
MQDDEILPASEELPPAEGNRCKFSKEKISIQHLKSLCVYDATLEYISERLCAEQGTEDPNQNDLIAMRRMVQRLVKERYGESFKEFKKRAMGELHMKIRKALHKGLEDGNVPIIKLMAAHYLDMSDKVETKISGEALVTVSIPSIDRVRKAIASDPFASDIEPEYERLPDADAGEQTE